MTTLSPDRIEAGEILEDTHTLEDYPALVEQIALERGLSVHYVLENFEF